MTKWQLQKLRRIPLGIPRDLREYKKSELNSARRPRLSFSWSWKKRNWRALAIWLKYKSPIFAGKGSRPTYWELAKFRQSLASRFYGLDRRSRLKSNTSWANSSTSVKNTLITILTNNCAGFSLIALNEGIKAGNFSVNGVVVHNPNYLVKKGDWIEIAPQWWASMSIVGSRIKAVKKKVSARISFSKGGFSFKVGRLLNSWVRTTAWYSFSNALTSTGQPSARDAKKWIIIV